MSLVLEVCRNRTQDPRRTSSIGMLAQNGFTPNLLLKASGLVRSGTVVSSDKRFKVNETPLVNACDAIHKLEPLED